MEIFKDDKLLELDSEFLGIKCLNFFLILEKCVKFVNTLDLNVVVYGNFKLKSM